jgi:hypothetical protein
MTHEELKAIVELVRQEINAQLGMALKYLAEDLDEFNQRIVALEKKLEAANTVRQDDEGKEI